MFRVYAVFEGLVSALLTSGQSGSILTSDLIST
jgi:hypothetical protein